MITGSPQKLSASILLWVALLLALCVIASGCAPARDDPPEGDGDKAAVSVLDRTAYPAGTPVGDWLVGCDAEDRNDQFCAYVLHHAATAEDKTVHTYLVYYRHGTDGMAVMHDTYQEGDNHRVELTYAPGQGTKDYSLLSVVLETAPDAEERVRLLVDGDILGAIRTETDTPIS